MTIPHTPPPNWTYAEHCVACGTQYITEYRFDTGYCSEVCERNDWDEDE